MFSAVIVFIFLYDIARRHKIPVPTTLSIHDKKDVILEFKAGELPAQPSPRLTAATKNSLGSVLPR